MSRRCASRAGQSPAVQGARDVWSYPEQLFLLLLLWGLARNDAKSIRQGRVAPFFCQSRLQQEIPALEFTIKPQKPHWSKQKYQILSLELGLRLHFYHTGRTKPHWVICFSFFWIPFVSRTWCCGQEQKNTSPWFPLNFCTCCLYSWRRRSPHSLPTGFLTPIFNAFQQERWPVSMLSQITLLSASQDLWKGNFFRPGMC